jgi:hypothetical protein
MNSTTTTTHTHTHTHTKHYTQVDKCVASPLGVQKLFTGQSKYIAEPVLNLGKISYR